MPGHAALRVNMPFTMVACSHLLAGPCLARPPRPGNESHRGRVAALMPRGTARMPKLGQLRRHRTPDRALRALQRARGCAVLGAQRRDLALPRLSRSSRVHCRYDGEALGRAAERCQGARRRPTSRGVDLSGLLDPCNRGGSNGELRGPGGGRRANRRRIGGGRFRVVGAVLSQLWSVYAGCPQAAEWRALMTLTVSCTCTPCRLLRPGGTGVH